MKPRHIEDSERAEPKGALIGAHYTGAPSRGKSLGCGNLGGIIHFTTDKDMHSDTR